MISIPYLNAHLKSPANFEDGTRIKMDNGDSEVQQSIVQVGKKNDNVMEQSFILCAFIFEQFIGVFIGSQISRVSGLLRYIGFKLFSAYKPIQFTAIKNVLIISVAKAAECIPITAGFVGIISALEYLINPKENRPLRLDWEKHVLWSIGLYFFDLIFAFLL